MAIVHLNGATCGVLSLIAELVEIRNDFGLHGELLRLSSILVEQSNVVVLVQNERIDASSARVERVGGAIVRLVHRDALLSVKT